MLKVLYGVGPSASVGVIVNYEKWGGIVKETGTIGRIQRCGPDCMTYLYLYSY